MKNLIISLGILASLTSTLATAGDLEKEVVQRRQTRQAQIREQVEARAKSRVERLLKMAGFGEVQVDETYSRDLCHSGGNGPGTACHETYELQIDINVKDYSGMICIGPTGAAYPDGDDFINDGSFVDCTDKENVTRRYSLYTGR